MTQTLPQTIPYEVFQREREKRLQAEQKCKKLENEIFLLRKIRRAPVLRPVDKDVLEEFHHVQHWGTVEDGQGNKRANYNTIAKNLHVSPDTVKRSAERLEKLHLADIREHQGPLDERERKYIQVKEETLASIDQLADPAGIVPKQGGNRYICTKCDSPDVDVKTEIKTTIRCNCCQHEEVIEDTLGKAQWKSQLVHKRQKAQKQLAFKKSKHTVEAEKQLADHSVYTLSSIPQKQLAFEYLRSRCIWVCHRDKSPYDAKLPPSTLAKYAHAKANDASTWATYEQTIARCEESQSWALPYDGIGFMCDGTFTVVDYDDSRDKETGEIKPLVLQRVQAINSYVEISVSGTGLHQIALARLPRNINEKKKHGIEMYDNNHFITYTGEQLPGTPSEIEDRQEQISALFAEIAPAEHKPISNVSPAKHFTCSRSDEEIMEIAMNAKNGEKFTMLFSGKWQQIKDDRGDQYYPTQSEADLALCKMIGHWCDQDVSTTTRLFQQSKLYREDRWNSNARAGETYGDGTLRLALGQNWQVAS